MLVAGSDHFEDTLWRKTLAAAAGARNNLPQRHILVSTDSPTRLQAFTSCT